MKTFKLVVSEQLTKVCSAIGTLAPLLEHVKFDGDYTGSELNVVRVQLWQCIDVLDKYQHEVENALTESRLREYEES